MLSFINAVSVGKDTRLKILEKHGIIDPQEEDWYDQQTWLDAFREIGETLGPSTLYNIGKAIPEYAKFPPEIDGLEKALSSIQVAYRMNHSLGEIGYYKLKAFDAQARQATMECMNPYPSEFDRGIITTMLRKFKPQDSTQYDVVLAHEESSRKNGGDMCVYTVTW